MTPVGVQDAERSRGAFAGAIRGVLSGLSSDGIPSVDFPGNSVPGGVPAQATVSIEPSDIGREAVLVFEDQDPQRPIVIGLVVPPRAPTNTRQPPIDVALDGRQLVLSAREEIVLRCGEASITLTRAGKVLIKGTYVLSKSTGVNRVKGGSVELN